jgi:hypothetical protein
MVMATGKAKFKDILAGSPRCIRLLDLAPSRSMSGESHEIRLSGSLRTVSLADSPKFTALSYDWGSPSSGTQSISCDGFEITITQNCHDSLVALRKRWEILTIWVDAICIDQENVSEISHQVVLMEEIYSWAETVFIWLRPNTKASDAAIDWFSLLPRVHQCLSPIKLVHARSISQRVWEVAKVVVELLRIRYCFLGELQPEPCRIDILSIFDVMQDVALQPYLRFIERYNVDDFNDLFGRNWLDRVWVRN